MKKYNNYEKPTCWRTTTARGLAGLMVLFSCGCTTAQEGVSATPNIEQAPATTAALEPTREVEVQPAPPIEGVELKAPASNKLVSVDLTRDDGEVWGAIRRGFAIPDVNGAAVKSQTNIWLRHRGSLEAMLQDSEPYIYYIAKECEKRSLPTELALIPFIESKFNPHARSSSSAAGLWQFIPSTGQHFKLKQNEWVDERRDLVASTRAALDYFTYLYEMYGDWQLALISFNWGEGSVAKAIQKAQDAGREPILRNLDLPAETAAYVPKLQALKNIISAPKQYRVSLPDVPNAPYFVAIKRKSDLDLRELAKMTGLKLEEFRQLNPGLKQPVLVASQSQTLLVPIDKADEIKSSLKNYKPPTRKPGRSYKVRKGDTIGGIAHKLKVSVHSLMAANGLKKHSVLHVGMDLTVPGSASRTDWNG
ncbi:MAG TPA: transglycosylase SLT domain-containing protein [Limnobacter sp.]|uniref:transglycosylase SLT domain-containing protein n=1 Tax=Limnobacter sp. TaxID=2003368 RepID=UPI002E3184CC|nr:transglycosylase SLT domain-containing protein [Limnobacter sp.]HEX5486803.1 transglycosylase SLT domain-containing protein [Limnobacter sp.]